MIQLLNTQIILTFFSLALKSVVFPIRGYWTQPFQVQNYTD
jgi:hypothetical protein